MPATLAARVQKIIKPPYLVTVVVNTRTEEFQDGVSLGVQIRDSSHDEWRVVAIVKEDFGDTKEVTLSRRSEAEAVLLLKVGAIAYNL